MLASQSNGCKYLFFGSSSVFLHGRGEHQSFRFTSHGVNNSNKTAAAAEGARDKTRLTSRPLVCVSLLLCIYTAVYVLLPAATHRDLCVRNRRLHHPTQTTTTTESRRQANERKIKGRSKCYPIAARWQWTTIRRRQTTTKKRCFPFLSFFRLLCTFSKRK